MLWNSMWWDGLRGGETGDIVNNGRKCDSEPVDGKGEVCNGGDSFVMGCKM